MIRFETRSGSSYEVDPDQKLIRRLWGASPPPVRFGVDGEWKQYEDLSFGKLGDPVVVFWPKGTPLLDGSPPCAVPTTVTSPVVFYARGQS